MSPPWGGHLGSPLPCCPAPPVPVGALNAYLGQALRHGTCPYWVLWPRSDCFFGRGGYLRSERISLVSVPPLCSHTACTQTAARVSLLRASPNALGAVLCLQSLLRRRGDATAAPGCPVASATSAWAGWTPSPWPVVPQLHPWWLTPRRMLRPLRMTPILLSGPR